MAQNKAPSTTELLNYIYDYVYATNTSVVDIQGRLGKIEAKLDSIPSGVGAVAGQSGLQSGAGAVASQSDGMSLTVDIGPLENIRLSVNPSDTISEVKDQIAGDSRISKAKLGFLIHENRQLLEEGKTLSEYEVKSGDKLVLPRSLNHRKQAKHMKIGMKVKPRSDLGGNYRPGDVATVTEELYLARDGGEYVKVCWDSDDMPTIESMGKPHGHYMLELA